MLVLLKENDVLDIFKFMEKLRHDASAARAHPIGQLLSKRGALLSGITPVLPHVDKTAPPRFSLHAYVISHLMISV